MRFYYLHSYVEVSDVSFWLMNLDLSSSIDAVCFGNETLSADRKTRHVCVEY